MAAAPIRCGHFSLFLVCGMVFYVSARLCDAARVLEDVRREALAGHSDDHDKHNLNAHSFKSNCQRPQRSNNWPPTDTSTLRNHPCMPPHCAAETTTPVKQPLLPVNTHAHLQLPALSATTLAYHHTPPATTSNPQLRPQQVRQAQPQSQRSVTTPSASRQHTLRQPQQAQSQRTRAQLKSPPTTAQQQ